MAAKPDIKFLSLTNKKLGEVDIQEWIDHLVSGFKLVLSQSLNEQVNAEVIDSLKSIKDPSKTVAISIVGSDSKIPSELEKVSQQIYVLLGPLEDKNEELKVAGAVNFEFFTLTDAEGPKVLEPTGFRDFGKNYWLKLVDLAYEINKVYGSKPSTNKKNVFLAAVNPRDRGVRDEIRRDLQRRGYSVLPKGNIPDDEKKASEAINADLKNVDLCIHVLGKEYGKEINASKKSMVDLQNSVAAEFCKKSKGKLRRIVWQSPDDIVKDQKQREYLDDLVKSPELLEGAEFLRIPIEHLKTLMVDILLGKGYTSNLAALTVDGPGDDSPEESTYVVFDPLDKKWAEEIIGEIKKGGSKVSHSKILGTVSESMAYHKKCLALSDSVVLLADKASPQWVVAKMKDILKSPGFGRIKDFSSRSFVASKNHKELADNAKKEGYEVIDKDKGTESKKLKETLKS